MAKIIKLTLLIYVAFPHLGLKRNDTNHSKLEWSAIK